MTTATLTAYDLPGPDTASKAAAIAAATSDRRFATMLQIAADTQWPESYTEDLYRHDLHTIKSSDPDTGFLFILREWGTHLYSIRECRTDRHCSGSVHDSINWHSGDHYMNTYDPDDPRPRFFRIYSNGTYNELTPAEALDITMYRQADKGGAR